MSGLRVASIGNAASAVQYVPEVAARAGSLEVYQRSPNWIVPRSNRAYDAAELAAFSTASNLELNRQALFDWREDSFSRMQAGSALAREQEALAREHLAAQVPDIALRARLTPTYPLGCKRILRSDDYYPALTRPHVSLVTQKIRRITSGGILRQDGSFSELDVIIYGTGFETLSFQGPVEVHGRQGTSLRDTWKDGAQAFLGMTVPGYPNFFMLYGPNTNLGHNTVLTMIEAQIAYVLQALDSLDALGPDRLAAIDVLPEVAAGYNDTVQREFAGSAWTGDCASWYKNGAGRVINNWSGTVREYRKLTERFMLAHYEFLP
jgi:cation diffusion facilitator CzcD-associated flavoprotein CzcO